MKVLITEKANGELYQPQSHRFVPWIHAPQDEQHGSYLAGRVDENEHREQDHVNPKVTALQLAVTDRRCAAYFRYRQVRPDTLAIVKLKTTKAKLLKVRRVCPCKGIQEFRKRLCILVNQLNECVPYFSEIRMPVR